MSVEARLVAAVQVFRGPLLCSPSPFLRFRGLWGWGAHLGFILVHVMPCNLQLGRQRLKIEDWETQGLMILMSCRFSVPPHPCPVFMGGVCACGTSE